MTGKENCYIMIIVTVINWKIEVKGESDMNERIAFFLNQKINKELYSAYLYLDMAIYYDEMDLDGYANWYTIQAQEERDHALLFMKYMQNNGLKVTLEAV